MAYPPGSYAAPKCHLHPLACGAWHFLRPRETWAKRHAPRHWQLEQTQDKRETLKGS